MRATTDYHLTPPLLTTAVVKPATNLRATMDYYLPPPLATTAVDKPATSPATISSSTTHYSPIKERTPIDGRRVPEEWTALGLSPQKWAEELLGIEEEESEWQLEVRNILQNNDDMLFQAKDKLLIQEELQHQQFDAIEEEIGRVELDKDEDNIERLSLIHI